MPFDARRSIALLSLAAAAAALILAVPRLGESAAKLRAHQAMALVKDGRSFDPALGEIAVAGIERALGWIESGTSHRDLALAQQVRMFAVLAPESLRPLREAAALSAERAVALSPADPYAWFRLASARATRGGVDEAAVAATIASIARGPYETGLLAGRLDILFAGRSHLLPEHETAIDEQIRILWQRQMHDLVRLTRRHGALDMVRRALERPPSLAQHLDESIANPAIR